MSTLTELSREAPRYELEALLEALFSHGFDWDTIRFEGVRDLSPERGELVRGLVIEERPARLAIVRLDTGLLSSNGPLPDYFREFASRLPDPDAFIAFMGFWDSIWLRAHAYAAFPGLSVDRSQALRDGYRARLSLGSSVSLHWLFRSLFPELGVEVTAAVFPRSSKGGRARVGSTLDGRLVIGAEFSERRPGYRVRLLAESAACEGVQDWEREARGRLRRAERLIARVKQPLEVVLRFELYQHGHALRAGTEEARQLGVRPWLRPIPGEQLGPGDVVVRGPFG